MASTELERSPSSSSNRKTYTFSAWVKRSKISSSYPRIFSHDYADTDRFEFFFYNTDEIQIEHVNNNSTDIDIHTTRRFRDTNAWYHIVLAVDTTQSTAADRLRFYVNGVQETSFNNTNYPGQNNNYLYSESITAQYFGQRADQGNTSSFDGCMSHIHMCDGYSYAASEFGETDSTTGEWKIKTTPSVSYGTNGYWILKDGNTVTDSSPNSNDFAVTGTLTKTEDCPSNVFATMNPLNVPTSNAPSFSNGSTKTVTAGSSGRFGGTSTLGMSSGKFYVEAKATVSSNPRNCIGTTYDPGTQARNNSTHYSYADGISYNAETGDVVNSSGTIYSASTYTTGDIIQMAIDMDNDKLYFGKNGTWLNSGDPTSGSTGTGAVSLTANKTQFIIQSDNTSGSDQSTFEFNFGNGYFGTTAVSSAGTNASNIGIFEYNVPTGYTALSTKGLNL